jgi:hypothetical protein
VHARPWEWNYTARDVWSATIVPPSTPLRLFDAAEDVRDLTFSRIGDGYRNGLFRVVTSAESGEQAMHFELPRVTDERTPDDYTASLVIVDRIAARRADIGRATAVRLRVRALGAGQTVHVTLMEADGTSWSAAVRADTTWSDVIVPLRDFKPARGVLLPEGFPGEWNYWVGPAERRGGSGDLIRLPDVERFQLSLRKADASAAASGAYGIEIESATLAFR